MSPNQPKLEDYPPEEQARQTRNFMWFICVGTVLLGGFMASQMMQVEFGPAQSVRVWWPVALLYDSFGFWPAILCVPVLGLLILLALAWKLRSITERASPVTPSQ